MSWIQTRSGKAVDLLSPEPDTIDFTDIAYALSRICRFTGHTSAHYSVAEHSVRVAEQLPAPIRIHGLLHDAPEYVLGDWATPIKQALARIAGPPVYNALKTVSHDIEHAIYAAAGIKPPCDFVKGAVKFADVTLLMTEQRDLLGPPPRTWDSFRGVEPLAETIEPWSAEVAADTFLMKLWLYAPHLHPDRHKAAA